MGEQKMKRSLFRIVLAAVIFILPISLAGASGQTDVIVQWEGDVEALIAQIQEIGGVISHRYENVNALAVTLPTGGLSAVQSLAGVSKVEKDSIVRLPKDRGDSGRPLFYDVDDMSDVQVEKLDISAVDTAIRPQTYLNYLDTGAPEVWGETLYGLGSIVAVVDTGTYPVAPCLSGAVIGHPDYPNGFDAYGDNPANADDNHTHGTWVGNVIASSCRLAFNPAAPTALAWALFIHAPETLYEDPDYPGLLFTDLLGIAPLAQIYPVKVFPKSGGGTPTSVILSGLDHILSLKNDGFDIDVVNMSLGGPTGFDGRDTYDKFIHQLKRAEILVVTSAGNSGPVPNTVGSPATSFASLSVGATDVVKSSRVLYEYLGLAVWPVDFGQGLTMRPTDETRIVNFSSRGPLSDGRAGPDMAALGTWNFVQRNDGLFSWVTGTSFSSPTVAGAAALLNSWWEGDKGKDAHPGKLRNALILGADPYLVGPEWRDFNDQGFGVLNVPEAFFFMKYFNRYLPGWFFRKRSGRLQPNVLGRPIRHQTEEYESDEVILKAGEKWDAVFKISRHTSKVTIEVYDIETEHNWPWAFWANALEYNLQSAKRTAAPRPLETALWNPNFEGPSFELVVEDGPWTENGAPLLDENDEPVVQPMEPGLMKFTAAGDFVNEDAVRFKVRIRRENFRKPLRHPVAYGKVNQGDVLFIPVYIPDDAEKATIDLEWRYNWARFPTNDLDLYLTGPVFPFPPDDTTYADASLNSPERIVLEDPKPGYYLVIIEGYEIHKPDCYKVFLTLE
jgi:subtilisin family serine protease